MMPYLRTEGILPNKIDRETPNECQYIKEWEVWEVYECGVCGNTFEEKPTECEFCGSTDFTPIEIIMED
jgi:rubrerythrin